MKYSAMKYRFSLILYKLHTRYKYSREKKWDTDVFQKFKNERWLSTRNLVRGSEPEVREITITSSEVEVARGHWNKHRTRCLSRTIDVIHCCRKIETLLIRRHFKFPFAAGPLVFDISTVNRIFFNIITCMLRTMIEPWILWGDDELNSPRDGYLHLLHGFTSMYFADESMITDKSTIVLFFFSFFFLIRFLSTYVFINLPVKL